MFVLCEKFKVYGYDVIIIQVFKFQDCSAFAFLKKSREKEGVGVITKISQGFLSESNFELQCVKETLGSPVHTC